MILIVIAPPSHLDIATSDVIALPASHLDTDSNVIALPSHLDTDTDVVALLSHFNTDS